jgi:hypothetical protein
MHRVPNVNGSKEAVYNPNSQLYSNEKRMINQWTLGVPYFPTNQCIRRYSWCENWGIRVTGHTARGNTWFQSQHTWGWPVYVLEVEHARIPTIWMLTQGYQGENPRPYRHRPTFSTAWSDSSSKVLLKTSWGQGEHRWDCHPKGNKTLSTAGINISLSGKTGTHTTF